MKKAAMVIRITNARTGEVITNAKYTDFPYTCPKSFAKTNQANHYTFSKDMPDCHVTFSWLCEGESDWNFIYGTPYNMKQDEIALDEGHMDWDEYLYAWHNGEPTVS